MDIERTKEVKPSGAAANEKEDAIYGGEQDKASDIIKP